MFNKKETALKVAESLLQIKAIKLQTKNPFTWASGWKSPIYCDNRISLSYPAIRTYIRHSLAEAITDEFGVINMIAGVATAGIPQGVLVAEELGLPFSYVRSAPKDHGMSNLIEGEVKSGQRVVIIEDLISTGSSSLKAVQALREVGCEVAGMAAIFSYGFKIAEENFRKAKCKLVCLSNYSVLIDQALASGYIDENELIMLKRWREDPENWSSEVLESK
jgi:orotate phosphoribosyltransferase